jgi:hypothetical protein
MPSSKFISHKKMNFGDGALTYFKEVSMCLSTKLNTDCTFDNGSTVRNILNFYYSVFSIVERHLVNLIFEDSLD